MPGTFTFGSMGSQSAEWVVGTKVIFLDASRAHCQADATSEMAIELPPEEQEKGQDLVGELLKSLHKTWKAAHNWEKERQSVLGEMNDIGTCSPAILCCRERQVCGFVHGDDFIFVGGSMRS